MEGIRAAHAGSMKAVGIGTKETLPEADYHMQSFVEISIEEIEEALSDGESILRLPIDSIGKYMRR